MEIHIVQPGDTVDGVAAAYGVPAQSIIYANQLPYPYPLAVGQALLLPSGGDGASARPPITAGGYAYPFISPWVLEQTLPYLTDLLVFSYGFTPEGELIPPPLDDSFLIAAAKSFGTAPILTLTPIGAEGKFNNYLILLAINNESAVGRLIENLLAQITERGFEGVDLDFEYILAEDRVPFAEFVRAVRTAVNALGFPVSVALAPTTSDAQPGLLYEGKDYALLGEAADSVLLMTYEWGYTYGPPMAVAPIDKVRQVVEYALTRIPAHKISLGVPNYGYDWPLPFRQGESKAATIGNVEAVQIAIAMDAAIQFDETAQAPFFRYSHGGTEHEAWFEDVRSLSAKFALVKEYGLRGAGYWQVMQLFRANWMLLADTFSIQKA